ncbi:hypothetical protein C3L33_06205, partial [Rhododendron williamsianum]
MIKWPKQITATLVEQLIKAEKDLQKAVLIFDAATGEYTNGFRHDLSTFGLMISRFVSVNQFRAAEDMLNRMKDEKCNITEDIFLSICRGYGRVHKPLEAIRVFQRMKEYDCEPTHKSYITVFSILADENQLKLALRFYRGTMDAALRIFREMPNAGVFPIPTQGKLREALEILDRMKLQGLKPDAGLYSKIINGFCDVHKFQKAANFLDEMVLEGISPNRLTWSLHVRIHNTVVQGLLSGIDPNRAFQLYLSMRTRGLSVEAKTFDSLVHCFCKKGDLHKAARIFEEMVVDGCIPDEGTWTAIVSGFWDRKKVREAAESIQIEVIGNVF